MSQAFMSKLLLITFAFFTLITSFGLAAMYPAIGSLYFRDQGYVNATTLIGMQHTHLLPYVNYPFEYPFFAGVLMLIVNAVAYLSSSVGTSLLIAIYWSSVMMGIFTVGTYVLQRRMGASMKRIGVFFAFSPLIIFSYDLPFDLAAMFFAVLSLYYLERKQDDRSAIVLALAAGVKAFPLLLAWPYAGQAKHRIRYLAISVGGFLGGMGAQFLLSPTNFFRAGSYLSSYGVEGSWLGLIFGHIINYQSTSTWDIGASTVLHLPQPYQLVSFSLLAISVLLVYRSHLEIRLKSVAVLSCVVFFWWWSPPQFLFFVLALLPLVAELSLTNVVLVESISIAGLFPIWARLPVPISDLGWIEISTTYQLLLALLLAVLVLKRARPRPITGILPKEDLPTSPRAPASPPAS